MAKRQRLTLQQVLDEIFIDSLSEDNEENHLEKDYSDSSEYLPELEEEIPNEVTDSDTRNDPVRSLQIKLVLQDFVVSAAVFQAVLLFFFATF